MKQLGIGLITLTLAFNSMAIERSFSGDKGNGGDGVILESTHLEQINMRRVIDWEDFSRSLSLPSSPSPTGQVYSLDLLDHGLERKLGVDFNFDKGAKQMACIKDAGCYDINDSDLFDELLSFESVFGEVIGETFSAPRAEFNSTDVLSKKYDSYRSNNARYEKFFYDYDSINRESMMNFLEGIVNKASKSYVTEAKRVFEDAREEFYSNDALVSIGVINKIAQIRQVNPTFASKIKKQLLELDWLLLNSELNNIADEGIIDSRHDIRIQMARRSNGTVKISDLGWSKNIKVNGVLAAPMTASNKVALIFHEVIYEMTKAQGDQTSARARKITAKLFRSSKSSRFIKQAYNLFK